MARIDEVVDERLEESGEMLADACRAEIVRQGLVDTGAFVASVGYEIDGDEVHAGTSTGDPVPYPLFLEKGFRHHQSGQIVGPYNTLTTAASNSEGPLRALWKQPIRG